VTQFTHMPFVYYYHNLLPPLQISVWSTLCGRARVIIHCLLTHTHLVQLFTVSPSPTSCVSKTARENDMMVAGFTYSSTFANLEMGQGHVTQGPRDQLVLSCIGYITLNRTIMDTKKKKAPQQNLASGGYSTRLSQKVLCQWLPFLNDSERRSC
jgi:hypothetical protein